MTEHEEPESRRQSSTYPPAGAVSRSNDCRQLEQAIAALETQRAILGDAVVDTSIAALREKLNALAEAEVPSPELQGERKLVTIMFADISGFTALAETMDPEAVRDMMNACFEQLVPVVEKYEGTVDKFIGDEIMALFGAPIAHENDPERALRAGLEMMEALTEFNTEQGTDLGLHFGINSGLVIAGDLGTRERQEYSVMGDAVNLAARLEDASERGGILVGPDTYRLTEPLFKFEALEPMRVKGKAEPVPVYRLLALRTVPGPVRGIKGLESPLVGRGAEFHALVEAVERLQAGMGGIVTLVGEAGLGKSRLIAELRGESGNLQWVEGHCLSYGTSIAYLLWLDALRGLLEVTAEDPPIAVRDRLREQVEALCPGRFEAVYPYLARLMSLPLTGEDEALVRGLKGEKLKGGTFRAVESLLESVAWRRPLTIICEDLHWADPTSIELLKYVLPLTDRAPLLLICVFRPEMGHGCWQVKETAARLYRHRHTDLWLDPLSTSDSKTLVGNLLPLPGELRDRILGYSEGNPFYVEEILRSLMDSGVIARNEANGRWEATRDVADIAIPDTLHGVLMARIDRLREETKRVLQLASVIGRVFLYRVLAEIAAKERELDDHLLTLQREEMIRERARVPELEYIFKHHLTQEAAYKGLLRKERHVFHRQVAEALERLFPDRLEEQLGLLAHHWERAEEPEKAAAYLSHAGDQACLAYAHQEAVDYYQRGLALLEALPSNEPRQDWQSEVTAQLNEGLGDVLELTGQHDEARAAYQRALAQFPKCDLIRQACLHRKIGNTWRSQRRYEEASQAYELAETVLGREPDESALEWRQEWVRIQLERMHLYYWQAQQWREMARLAEKTRPVVERYGTPTQRASFFESLVRMHLSRDRFVVSEETLTHSQAALAASEESGNLVWIAEIRFVLAFVQLWRGDLNGAEEEMQTSLALAERTGDVALQTHCLTYLTIIYRKRGQMEETRHYTSRSLAAATAGKMLVYVATAKANLAWTAWHGGNLSEAEENGRGALEMWPPVYPFQWTALWPLIGVALAQDRVSEAIDHTRALLEPTQQRLPDTLTKGLEEAIEAWEGGEPERARTGLDRAIELAQDMDYL